MFIVEAPAIPLGMAKGLLKEQGIRYQSIDGGLLSGFTLKGVNYKNQLKAEEVTLKVDLEALKNRQLVIDELTLDGVEIEKDFLTSLIDSNSSKKPDDSNSTLPFDTVIIHEANIGLKNIAYKDYFIKSAKLKVRNLSGDIKKKQYKGGIHLLLLSNVTQLDLNASINNKKLSIIANIKPKSNFINSFLTESNITLTSNPSFTLKADGEIEGNINYHLSTHRLELKQNEHQIKSNKLIILGSYSMPKEELDVTLSSKLLGSMATLELDSHAKLNLNDINNTLHYTLESNLNPKQEFLTHLLAEQNVTFLDNPNIKLKSSGGFKKLKYHLVITQLNLMQNAYHIKSNHLLLSGNFGVLNRNLSALLQTQIQGNIAELNIDMNSSLNLDDINNTLYFDFKGDVQGKEAFVNEKLVEQNITIISLPKIVIEAKGTLQDILFQTEFQGLQAKQNDIEAEIKSLNLHGKVNALKGDTKLNIKTDFDSSAGGGNLKALSSFNFNELEKSLTFTAHTNIEGKPTFINPLLGDENIRLQGTPTIIFQAEGSLEQLTAKIDATADIIRDNNLSKITLNTSPIQVNLKNNHIDGSLKMRSDSKNIKLNLESTFKGDYTQLKVLHTNSTIHLTNFNAFGVNLNPLTPLHLNVKNSTDGALITLDSKRIKLTAKTHDYDHFNFHLHTGNLYLYKIIELPSELDHKFIKTNIKGEATLSNHYFNLSGVLQSNKKFKLEIEALNNQSGLDAQLKSQHLVATVKGDITKKQLQAEINTPSLAELQKEFNALYTFKTVKVDGSLNIKAQLKGEAITAKINAPKLTFEGFRVEELNIDANYQKELLTLNTFKFKTKGFKDKKLNKDFYLNQAGKIHLGQKRDVLIDMYPNIFIKATGNKEQLTGKIRIKKLPLGHPDYGSMVLNSDIRYQQDGKNRSIDGWVTLNKMKLFYESKFLNADNDADVIIITKKDKQKKASSDDSFLKHTSINLKIKAPQAKYKTPDIELLFDINLKAHKAFGKELEMLGRVKEITGRVDQVPKRFEVKNSTIVFKGGKKINPLLDIHVEYELPYVLIFIDIGGDANRPKIEFSSEPPMPKKDIMSYLLFGVSTASIGKGEGSIGREAELFIINQAARDLAYEMELDRVFVADDGTGEGFAIEIGKKISKKNMLIIESSKEGNSFILEHDVSKNIKLRIGQHQKERPSQSIDIYFKKRFK